MPILAHKSGSGQNLAVGDDDDFGVHAPIHLGDFRVIVSANKLVKLAWLCDY